MGEETSTYRVKSEGIDKLIRDLASIVRAQTSTERAASKATREMAKMGSTVTKEFANATKSANEAAKQAGRTLSAYATSFSKIVSVQQKRMTQENALKALQIQLRVEEEKTARARLRNASSATNSQTKQMTQQQALVMLQTRLQIAQQRTAQITIAANTAIQLSQGKTTVTTQQLAAMWSKLAGEIAGVGAAGAGAGGGGGGGIGDVIGGVLGAFPSITGMITALASSAGGIGAVVVGLMSVVTWAGRAAMSIGRAGLTAALNLAKTAFSLLVAPIKAAVHALGSFINRVAAVATGVLIRDVIFGIMRTMKELTSETLQASAAFQTLQVRLENLLSREVRTADQTVSLEKSMKIAGLGASNLINWIKQLSLLLPFDVEVIGNTQSFGMAMGFSAEEAKNLTGAVLNYTAAMGLTSDVAERIIFNFGQMKQQGKVTSTEMRDLARGAFFPLSLVLQEVQRQMGDTGMSFMDVKKAASEGKIPVEAFFKAFETVVARDLPGAAERMGQTFTGAMTRIKNFFKTIIGGEVFGPLVAQIGKSMSSLADRLADPRVREAATWIGKAILRAFTVIQNSVKYVGNSLKNLANAFGLPTFSAWNFAKAITFVAILIRRGLNTIARNMQMMAGSMSTNFQETAKKAHSWGYNIVAMFAKGMAAAINLIVLVINTISQLLSHWFKGSSPPLIAKDIDKWGANMIAEWVKGWSNFDISTFSDIANTIESFFRSISRKFGEKGLIPAILGARKNIADAINAVRNGMMTAAGAADFVFQKVGRLTKEFKNYIIALFDVEEASKRVSDANKEVAKAEEAVAAAGRIVEEVTSRITKAQDELSKIQEKYEKILEDLNDQLSKVTEEYDEQQRLAQINEAINSGLLTDAEKERLEMEKRAILIRQQIRDTEKERDSAVDTAEQKIALLELEKKAAEDRQKAAEQEVEAAKQRVDAAQRELDAAQERLELSKAIIAEQIKQNELVQEQIDLLKALAAQAGGGAGDVSDLADAFDDLSAGLFDTGSGMTRFEEEVQKIKERGFAKMFTDMNTAVSNFLKSFDGKEGVFAPVTTALDNLNIAVGTLVGLVTSSGKEGPVERALRFEKGNVKPIEDIAWTLTQIKDVLLKIPLGGILGVLDTFSKLAANIDWEKLGREITYVAGTIQNIIAIFNYFGANLLGMWFAIWAYVVLILATKIGEIGSYLFGLVDDALKKFYGWDTDLRGLWDRLWGWVVEKVQWVFDQLVGKSIIPQMVSDIITAITTFGTDLTKLWETLWTGIRDFVSGIFNDPDGIIQKTKTAISDIITAVTTFSADLTLLWETLWGNLKTFISGIFNDPDGIVQKVKTAVNDLAIAFSTTLTNAINNFRNNVLTPLITKLEAAWEKFKKLLGLEEDDTKKQTGGVVSGGRSYLVGERGPELFMPPSSGGFIFPAGITSGIMRTLQAKISAQVVANPMLVGGNSVNNYYSIEINPSYRNVQSEASIMYDVTAALAAARR